MKELKINDKVKIINREPWNNTGVADFNKPFGDVGKIGFVEAFDNAFSHSYRICLLEKPNTYLGYFRREDLELIESESVIESCYDWEYVRCIKNYNVFEVGRIYKKVPNKKGLYSNYKGNNWSCSQPEEYFITHFEKSTEEDFEAQKEKKIFLENELEKALLECSSKFPIGAKVKNMFNCTFKIDIANFVISGESILFKDSKTRTYTVYSSGEWAEVISFSEQPSKPIDFSELDLEEWLVETKKLNLSLEELAIHIRAGKTCNFYYVFEKLKGAGSFEKAEILYKHFYGNFEKKEDFCSEPIIDVENPLKLITNIKDKKETVLEDVRSITARISTNKKITKLKIFKS